MTAQKVSMGSPFEWLMRALDVGRRNPVALFLGFFLMIVVGLVPSVLQFAGDWLLGGNDSAALAIYLVSLVVSFLLMPPMVGAAFVLLDRCERGQQASPFGIFDGFRDVHFALRMILVAILFVALYLLVVAALVALLPGKEALKEIFLRALATPPGSPFDTSGLPPVPAGLIWWLLGAMFMFVLLGNAYMLAFAQAALGGRHVVDAVFGGFAAVFRNLLPFLGFATVTAIVGFVVLFMAAVVIGVIFMLLMAVHDGFANTVALLMYLALMLAIYVVVFGFYYHAWREIFPLSGNSRAGDDTTLAA